MPDLTYVGPSPEVVVDGQRVKRGESGTFDEDTAASLAESAVWTAPQPPKKTPKKG